MDEWCDQRRTPRTEPFVSPLPEIDATCPRCSRADFRRDHRSQDAGHRAQIRACGNVKEIRGDPQAAGDTPPAGVGAKDREMVLPATWVFLVVIICGPSAQIMPRNHLISCGGFAGMRSPKSGVLCSPILRVIECQDLLG